MRHLDLAKALQRGDLLNRGIAGDRAVDMPQRLDHLLFKKPDALVIEGGMNDIAGGLDIKKLMQAKRAMLAWCRKHGIEPIFMHTLPVARRVSLDFPGAPPAINEKVVQLKLNAKLDGLQKEGVAVIEAPQLADPDGFLRA